jgi:uncharacterized protein YutE (UPF0331/DUF86 family)
MTDHDLVEKRLAFIETLLREMRQLVRADLLHTDVKELRFAEHSLQLAIQAALDVASHIVADDRLGEPRTNRELFDLLVRANWLNANLGSRLANMAGLRNVLVHGYLDVDLAILEDVLANHLSDLDEFVVEVTRHLRANPEV